MVVANIGETATEVKPAVLSLTNLTATLQLTSVFVPPHSSATVDLSQLSLTIATYVLAQAENPAAGTIQGVVIDEAGKPVGGVRVHIAEMKAIRGHRLLQFVETNTNGQFVISPIPWGTYVVLTSKEESGYPDTKMAFYSNLAAPTVSLQPRFPVGKLTVQLGPKAGILELVSVIDATTGKQLQSASITLRRVRNPNLFIRTSTTSSPFLVPSLADVSIEISAPGYKSWPAGEGGKGEGQIRLKPGEVLKLAVKLQPLASKPNGTGRGT